jgi:hypothetical protein
MIPVGLFLTVHQRQSWENAAITSMTILIMFVYLIYYARAFDLTSHAVVLVTTMFVQTLVPFMWILVASTTATAVAVAQMHAHCEHEYLASFEGAVSFAFYATFGQVDTSDSCMPSSALFLGMMQVHVTT